MTTQKRRLHIRVVDVGGLSWWSSVLAVLFSQSGNKYCRFEAILDPPESGPALAPSPTFAVVRGIPSDLPPQAEWSLGMTEALKDLQARLAAEGWIQTKQGAQAWDLTYEHP